MNHLSRLLLAAAVVGTSFSAPGAISKEHLRFFETKIRPVLANNCYKCHSASEKVKGGLTVDSKKGLLAGGDSGPAIVPGNAKASLLFKAISYQDDYEMPPNAKLPDNVIADFERWINMGAPDPRSGKNRHRQGCDGTAQEALGRFCPSRNPASPVPTAASTIKSTASLSPSCAGKA